MTTSSSDDLDARRTPVVRGHRLAQRGHAGGDGVAEVVDVEQPLGLLADGAGGAGRGLPGHEVDQVAVTGLALRRRGQQVHHVEGRHVGAASDLQAVAHGGHPGDFTCGGGAAQPGVSGAPVS